MVFGLSPISHPLKQLILPRKAWKGTSFTKYFEVFLYLNVLGCVSVLGFGPAGHYILFPEWPVYWTSLLNPASPGINFWFFCYLINLAVHLFLTLNISLFCVFAFAAFTTYSLHVIPLVIMGSFTYKRGAYFSSLQKRGEQYFTLYYRRLQLLHSLMVELGGPGLIPTQTLVMKMVVACAYLFVRQWAQLRWNTIVILSSWTQVVWLGWSLVLILSGKFYVLSEAALGSWKRIKWPPNQKGCGKLILKFRRSCQPLAVQSGKMFVVRKITILKFQRGVVRGIFRALLAIQ